MIQSEVKIRVLYAHTDVMGIVNNGRYFEYFEAGRNTLLRDLGFPYAEMESKNIGLPLIEAHANYISTAVYDDIIVIRATLKNIPTVRVRIDYEAFVDDVLIATGYTTHAFTTLDTLKPIRPPQEFLSVVKSKIGD